MLRSPSDILVVTSSTSRRGLASYLSLVRHQRSVVSEMGVGIVGGGMVGGGVDGCSWWWFLDL